jgi:GAF domain-containing protein
VLLLNQGNCVASNCILAGSDHQRIEDFAGSIYDRAITHGQPQVIEDLSVQTQRFALEDALLASGTRALVVAPLYYRNELTGWLELSSPRPGDLDAMNAVKLREVLPIISIALRRALEELNSRVVSVIQANWTAIHPSVAWRFRQAALRSLERGEREATAMEPIVFRNVYPLFASADIRDSSIHRSLAIQADIITRLRLAGEVVLAARDARALPILDELCHRITRRIE